MATPLLPKTVRIHDEQASPAVSPTAFQQFTRMDGSEESDEVDTDEEEITAIERQTPRAVLAFVVAALLFTVLVVSSSTLYAMRYASGRPRRSVILMVSDGMGPASATFGRTVRQLRLGRPAIDPSPLDAILTGTVRTRSYSSLVTDSAAGGTAFSCGIKTNNTFVGVDPHARPCATVLEAAHIKGYRTGIVATSRVTHATPAAFTAHAAHRDWEDDIAVQQIGNYSLGRVVDLVFAGGRCFFKPRTDHESCRRDERDLLAEATSRFGWATIASNRSSFDAINTTDGASVANILPILGLLAPDHLAYDIDRVPLQEPSLAEMTTKALQLLAIASRDSSNGFFLLVEGSRIDMAAHSNDPVAHAQDIAAYMDAVAAVVAFVDANPGAVMLSVSDHETGGLTLGRQTTTLKNSPDYVWYPNVIARAKTSAEMAIREMVKKETASPRLAASEYIPSILAEHVGITNASDSDIHMLGDKSLKEWQRLTYLGDMIAKSAVVGWTTRGHTGVDINLYAHGAGTEALRGNIENTAIADFVAAYLGLDLRPTTELLQRPGAVHIRLDKPPKRDHRFHYIHDID